MLNQLYQLRDLIAEGVSVSCSQTIAPDLKRSLVLNHHRRAVLPLAEELGCEDVLSVPERPDWYEADEEDRQYNHLHRSYPDLLRALPERPPPPKKEGDDE